MLVRTRPLRLLLSLSLGLAFFGCMGLPRRKPLAESALPELPQRPTRPGEAQPEPPPPPQRQTTADPVSAPNLRQAAAEEPPPAPTPVGTPVARATAPPPQPSQPPTEPSKPPQPAAPEADKTSAAPANPLTPVRQLHQTATQSYAGIKAYIVRLTRREFIKGTYQPEEVLLFKFRKAPFSVYLKWVGTVNKGREVLYVKGRYEGKIHTHLAADEMPVMPRHIALDPNNVLVKGSSRHSITEAGVGTLLGHIGDVLEALEKGDKSKGTLTYLGQSKRAEFQAPLEAIEWKLPPGVDPSLPRGGSRWCFCDRDNHLPALIITHDETGKEVEYYRYDRYQLNVPLDEDDFNPDKLWARPGRSPALR